MRTAIIIEIAVFWIVFAIGLFLLIEIILSEFCNIEKTIRKYTNFSYKIIKYILVLIIEVAVFLCIHIVSSIAYTHLIGV